MSRPPSRSQLHIWPEEPSSQGDILELKTRLEHDGADAGALWYRVPVEHRASLTQSLDPFLIGTVFLAMRRGADLHVHGRVSPSLLRTLEEFRAAWRCWRPDRYHPIDVVADTEGEDERAPSERAVMMFSGGLDSCFTAWRHTNMNCGRRRASLEAGLMVHGFDIPVEKADAFARAAESARTMCASVGLELIPLAFNFRQLGDTWEDAHGAALASCLHLFRGRFAVGLVAASHVYSVLRFPWGSNPITDAMLSSKSLSVVYDGGEFARHEKAREVAAWSEAMARVRVCWEATADTNCGACAKCIATAICFAVADQRMPASLLIASPEEAVRKLEAVTLKPVPLTRYEQLLDVARASKIDQPWVAALGRCLRRQRRATAFRTGVHRVLSLAPGGRRS